MIGPMFIYPNLIGEIYLDMLEKAISFLITAADENQVDRDANSLLPNVVLPFWQSNG